MPKLFQQSCLRASQDLPSQSRSYNLDESMPFKIFICKILWYIVDKDNAFYETNRKCSEYPLLIKVCKLLIRLSSKVVYGPLYACGKQEVSYKKTLYAAVECTRDLSNADCKNCLDFAINEFLGRTYKMRE